MRNLHGEGTAAMNGRLFIKIDPADQEELVKRLGTARGSSCVLLWDRLNLMAFRNGGPAFNATLSGIQRDTGFSRAKANEYLSELKRLQFIAVEKRYDQHGHRAANRYTLLKGCYAQSSQYELRESQSLGNELRKTHSTENELDQSSAFDHKSELLLSRDIQESPHKPPKGQSRFPEFWNIYPLKKGKVAAEKKWKAKNLDAIADRIIADVQNRMKDDRQWLQGYIPHGSTYVNQEIWQDDIETGEKMKTTTRPQEVVL